MKFDAGLLQETVSAFPR